MFALEREKGLVLSRVLPLLLHGDEGRGRKRNAVLCMNAHPILGYGVETRNRKRKLLHRGKEQQMNYTGNTYASRLLLAMLPKAVYDLHPDSFYRLVEIISKDICSLAEDGLKGPDGLQYWCVSLYTKGDWPYLCKIGRLTRSFRNMPKQASSKKDCTGICHLCLAGRPRIPFEDYSKNGVWQFSVQEEEPWQLRPEILRCPHDESFPETFFAIDPWHSFHLGEGRNLVANAVQLMLDFVDGDSVDQQLNLLYLDYKQYCKRNSNQVYALRFTKELFSLNKNDYPTGSWTKGNLTTSLVKWVAYFFRSKRNTFAEGSLHMKLAAWHDSFLRRGSRGGVGFFCDPIKFFHVACKADAAAAINDCFSKLYLAPLWVPRGEAYVIANLGFKYLELFMELAKQSREENRMLFLLNPKGHMLMHVFKTMLWEADLASEILNPLAMGVQLEEDLVGKTCRLVRHVTNVSSSFAMKRTFQRYRAAAFVAWAESKMVIRA